MTYTSFGEFVRILRIKHHEVMGDMAKVLDVKTPFLSAVETGKKNVPTDWIDKLVEHYSLSEFEKRKLENAIEESRTQYKIMAQNASVNQRRVAMQFARAFDDIDDETALKIMKLLKKKGDIND